MVVPLLPARSTSVFCEWISDRGFCVEIVLLVFEATRNQNNRLIVSILLTSEYVIQMIFRKYLGYHWKPCS